MFEPVAKSQAMCEIDTAAVRSTTTMVPVAPVSRHSTEAGQPRSDPSSHNETGTAWLAVDYMGKAGSRLPIASRRDGCHRACLLPHGERVASSSRRQVSLKQASVRHDSPPSSHSILASRDAPSAVKISQTASASRDIILVERRPDRDRSLAPRPGRSVWHKIRRKASPS